MKCAFCLIKYLNGEIPWVKIAEAATIFDGIAVCMPHLADRTEEPQ